MLPKNAIEISALSKRYKPNKKQRVEGLLALNDVTLDIPRGSLFGLLGPNGAGKSTLINILVGLVMKTHGTVKVWDYDIDRQTRQSKSCIGVVPQELNIDPFFTPYELMEVQAGLYGVPKHERRTDEILDMVGLSDKRNSYARTLSGGMRRRLLIAKALVHNPPILVLDEPTAGVDIELRQQLWENVVALNKQGTTVLLTTHYLEEAEQLCDRIAIINKGTVVANEEKKQLISRLDAKIMRVELGSAINLVPDELADLAPQLDLNPETGHSILSFSYKPSATHAGDIIGRLAQTPDLSIKDITTVETDLEDIFLQLTRSDDL